MNELLKKDFSAVYVTHSQTTLGALCALNQHGNKNIDFIGYDVKKSLDNQPITHISTSYLGKCACEIILAKLLHKQKRRIQQNILPYLIDKED